MPRKPKSHLCNKCGETEPTNFYSNRKSECRKCFLAQSNTYNHLNSASSNQAIKETAKAISLKKFTPVPKAQDFTTVEELSVKINELITKIHRLESQQREHSEKLNNQKNFDDSVQTILMNNTDNINAINDRLDRHSQHIYNNVENLRKTQSKSFTSIFV